MVGYEDLKNANPAPLRGAGDAAKKFSRDLRAYPDEFDGHVRSLKAPVWSGEDADLARAELSKYVEDYNQAGAAYERVDAALNDLFGEVTAAKHKLGEAESLAAAIPATISGSGTITPKLPPGTKPTPEQAELMETQLQQAGRLLEAALKQATDADNAARNVLSSIVLPDKPNVVPGETVREIPKPGTDPKLVSQWWQGLTDEERAALIENNPKRIGALDGIPAIDRDQANRNFIDDEQKRIPERIKQIDEEMKRLDDGGLRTREEYDLWREKQRLQGELDNLNALEKKLDGVDAKGGEKPYLLKVDPAGDGKAVVSIGNPDTADNVATYVPGTGTNVQNLDVGRAEIMQGDAAAADPTKDTAAIVWLDYDAPDGISNAASDDYYKENGTSERLANFQQGLRETHQGERSHNTLLGHSYGASTVGYTAANHATDVDDLVQVASPGTGHDGTAADFKGVSSDHVWATRAPDDPITISTDQGFLGHGTDPRNDAFGGKVFPADPGGHSNYWEEEAAKYGQNQARDHIATIITGRYDKVPDVRGDYNEEPVHPHY